MQRLLSYRSLLVATAIALAPLAVNAQATAGVTCKDGTASAATGRGACSGHGGVDKAASKAAKRRAKAAKAEAKAEAKEAKEETKTATKDAKQENKTAERETRVPARETRAAERSVSRSVSSDVRQTNKIPNATASNTDPTNATAKCKDGTYSHAATHRGACSRHGGVAEWLKS